jgi:transcriptional regulator GlxA family with amidase domain
MTPFRTVAAYVPADAVTLAVGMVGAVFRSRPGLTDFRFVLCTDRPGPVATDLGVPIAVEHGPDALVAADLALVLPGGCPPAVDRRAPDAPADALPSVLPDALPGALLDALRAAHRRGAVVAGHCAGVFALAAAGLLDGRRATTHWQYAAELARRHPTVTVDADALYVDGGAVLTGAGAAAGMDLYLHLVRREHGAALANELARTLVVPPHREGGQRQYVAAPVPADADGDRLADLLAWAGEHLDQHLTVDALAARALMSRRSFIRHFRAATGATPHAWLVAQRLARAEELLETTDLGVEQVAERVGFGSAAVLREQFTRRRGTSPRAYRRTFART